MLPWQSSGHSSRPIMTLVTSSQWSSGIRSTLSHSVHLAVALFCLFLKHLLSKQKQHSLFTVEDRQTEPFGDEIKSGRCSDETFNCWIPVSVHTHLSTYALSVHKNLGPLILLHVRLTLLLSCTLLIPDNKGLSVMWCSHDAQAQVANAAFLFL